MNTTKNCRIVQFWNGWGLCDDPNGNRTNRLLAKTPQFTTGIIRKLPPRPR